MQRFYLLTVVVLLTSIPVSAAHIVTETRSGANVTKRTHTYANASGDLRIEEQAIGRSATAGADTAAHGTVSSFRADKLDNTMLYQSKGKAVVSVEGKVCRRMTADSAPPPGMPAGTDLKQINEQVAAAMSQANKAMEDAMQQARKQGMTKEQERAMQQWTQPFLNSATPHQNRETTVEKINDSITVAGFKGEGYQVTDQRGNRHRVWLAPVDKIPGASQVRTGMENMYAVFAGYLDNMGGAGLIDRGMFAVFMQGEFRNMYPVRIETLDNGEVTEIVEANAKDGTVDYYPECEVQDMFGR